MEVVLSCLWFYRCTKVPTVIKFILFKTTHDGSSMISHLPNTKYCFLCVVVQACRVLSLFQNTEETNQEVQKKNLMFSLFHI